MKKVLITHDLNSCIHCGSCLAEAADFLEQNEKRETTLKNGQNNGSGIVTLEVEVSDDQIDQFSNAVNMCPVNALSIKEL